MGDLKRLKVIWEQKLKDSGFTDIEGPNGEIKTYDRRTVSWDNRDGIRDFFIKLDHFLESSNSVGIPDIELRILKFYSAGVQLKTISHEVQCSYAKVKMIISKYKDQILGL